MTDILTLLVPPSTSADLAGEASKVLAMRPTLEAIQVRGPDDEQFLSDIRLHIAERVKAIEAQRKTITVPLDQAKKAVDALFRPAREAYETLDDFIRKRLGEVETARRERARLACEAAKRLAAGGDLAAAEKAMPVAEVRPEGTGYVESWVLDTADMFALVNAARGNASLLCFLKIDMDAVKAYLKTYKNSSVVPEIPGFVFKRVSEARRK